MPINPERVIRQFLKSIILQGNVIHKSKTFKAAANPHRTNLTPRLGHASSEKH